LVNKFESNESENYGGGELRLPHVIAIEEFTKMQ